MEHGNSPAPKDQPCNRALEKLELAKQSSDECVAYNICPACGGNLIVVRIAYETQKECTCCTKAYRD